MLLVRPPSRAQGRQGKAAPLSLAYTLRARIWATVNSVSGASVPPARKRFDMPARR